MTNYANPFAPLIDPASVLAPCAASEILGVLRTHAHRLADPPSDKVAKDLVDFDAAIDAAVPKSSRVGVTGRTAPMRRGRSGAVERRPAFAASDAESKHASLAPTDVGVEMLVAASSESAHAEPETPVATEERTKAPW